MTADSWTDSLISQPFLDKAYRWKAPSGQKVLSRESAQTAQLSPENPRFRWLALEGLKRLFSPISSIHKA